MAKKLVGALVLGGLLMVGMAGPALAQQYPQVASLTAFSPEANFMSLPGYLRLLVFQQIGNWITMEEATRVVNQQAGR
ncbi:MAG: hypothetical protein HY660_04270 [Armatimonadetes bacterium]|nr:hypothetical protein [Armatimonadota bacterium]